MATVTAPTPAAPAAAEAGNLADLLERLGNVPPERVRVYRLGCATEEDFIEHEARTGRLCELVDGVIVEKAMGFYESRLALLLGMYIELSPANPNLGFVLGEAGMVRIERQVREPDVCFYFWHRFPNRLLPRGAILGMAPDWAVEVLSPSNTRGEMERKRREYFAGGAQLVWEVLPDRQAVRVYTAPDTFTEVGIDGTLDGGAVLPGFTLPVREWFERAGRRQAP